jgi:hypothetical protein
MVINDLIRCIDDPITHMFICEESIIRNLVAPDTQNELATPLMTLTKRNTSCMLSFCLVDHLVKSLGMRALTSQWQT